VGGRASIVGAAETSVGKVRDHNEDAHFIDPEQGIFIVCDGMGGHAAGEVASALAVSTIRAKWTSNAMHTVADQWLAAGTADARKHLLHAIQQGVVAAHDAIVAEAEADRGKSGMGTTLVGALVVGGDVVFAHCGDSRAYLVRDGIAMQLTEDHTLLARLLAAGVDVDVEGEGIRFKSMLTNALGIGHECKVSTFVVPVADGDRFLLCSDGITEYVKEHEIGEVLSGSPSPARAAQRLVEMALQRGGGDNATALVVRVLEAGDVARPSENLRREEQAIHACPLWAKVNAQQRLRALRIALPRDYAEGEKLPAQTLGDRVAWIIVEGELLQDAHMRGPGSLIYPEALLTDRPLPDKDGLAVCQSEVRGLAIRSDDFRELCDEDPDLAEVLLAALATEMQIRRPHRTTGKIVVYADGAEALATTDPGSTAGFEETLPGTRAKLSGRESTEPPPADAPAEPPARLSSPRMARASSPPSSLIAAATDVEGDLDRAMTDMTAERRSKRPSMQLAPVDDDDSEIVVDSETEPEPPPVKQPNRSLHQSEPEISIVQLEDAADNDDGDGEGEGRVVSEVLKDTSSQKVTITADQADPEIAVEPLVASDSGPHHPRSKRQTDAPD
jgi:serine/threonine protein phosphatase PrpC